MHRLDSSYSTNRLPIVLVLAAVASSFTIPVWAANEAFQDFFFDVCSDPSGALALRCSETDSGLGNLSGDSESSLNPSQTLSSADAAVFAAQQRSQEVRERMRSRRESDDGVESGDARVDLGPFSLLLNARTATTKSDRRVDLDAERGYELDEAGAEVGLDYRISDRLVLGGWVQWGDSEVEFDRENFGTNFNPLVNAGDTDTDRLGVTTYLSAGFGEAGFIDASLGYTKLDVSTSRNSVFQESNRVVNQTDSFTAGDVDGDEFMFTLTAGYQTTINHWNLTPFAGVTYVDTSFDDYVEDDLSAAGLALGVSIADQTLLMGQFGLSVSRAYSMDGWVLLPQLRVEYLVELNRDRAATDVRYVNDAGNNVFNLRGDESDDDRIDIAVGIAGVLPNGWIPFVEYQVTTGTSDLDRYQINAGLRIEL